MKKSIAVIKANKRLTSDVYEMELDLPLMDEDIRPGQFINIRLDGLYLRRPISICDWDDQSIRIIYRTVGKGTEKMSRMEEGETLDIIWPLGNGFDISKRSSGEEADMDKPKLRPLLIGGGVGIPPLYGLCRRLIDMGEKPTVVLGFRSEDEVFYADEFKKLGAEVILTTEDGSLGKKGRVTDVLAGMESYPIEGSQSNSVEGQTNSEESQTYSYEKGIYIFACGPEPMLKALDEMMPEGAGGQISFEERMGCGFGACMGCSCETKYGAKRICKDGPVLERGEIIW